MNTVIAAVDRAGGITRTPALRAAGFSRRDIEAAIRDGVIVRVIRPWVASRRAERDAVIAVLHHGRLTDASALGSYGVWRGLDRAIHVQLPRSARGSVATKHPPLASFTQPEVLTEGVVRHWVHANVEPAAWRVTVVEALASFARSQSDEMFIAAVDSALHEGAMKPSDLPELRRSLPKRLRHLLTLVDRRAESGCESLARLRLASLGRTIDIQVWIGRHRVDLLIEGWLVIEIDSEKWHAATRVEDSRRDTFLIGRGYRVKHFDYAEVLNDWPAVEAAVVELLRTRPQALPNSARQQDFRTP